MTNKWTMVPICHDELLRSMYVDQMMTTPEIAKHFGCSAFKVASALKRIGVTMRQAVSRVPKKGSLSGQWKGDKATYSAYHHRVASHRGKPNKCEKCGTTEGRFQWCNLTGNYPDVNDYIRLCIPCHRQLDYERRLQTGKMTSMHGSKDGKFRLSTRAIMTEEQVLEAMALRHNDHWTWTSLGKRYGVCGNAVKAAVDGKNWKHLHKKDGAESTGK